MTNCNAVSANDIPMPANKALSQCHHDAEIVSQMLLGIDLMGNEGKAFDSPRIAITMAALEKAEKLAADLDAIKLPEGS